jgi:hypothetical protein
MLFDQSDVDIGFAHRSDFCGHFGAAWHKEVALFEFLQSVTKRSWWIGLATMRQP